MGVGTFRGRGRVRGTIRGCIGTCGFFQIWVWVRSGRETVSLSAHASRPSLQKPEKIRQIPLRAWLGNLETEKAWGREEPATFCLRATHCFYGSKVGVSSVNLPDGDQSHHFKMNHVSSIP